MPSISHGFTTLALAYFGLEGLASHLEKIPLEIIQEAIDYLKKSPYADSIRLGLYGRSKGAEFALLAASHYDDFKCLVLNSPSYLCLEGLKQWRNSKTSSWTYQGQELPYHPFLWKDFFQRLIFKKDLKNINHQAVIPVEKINGSLLLLVSKKDEVWDAYGSAITIVNRLQQKRFKYPYQVESYENCGHMMTVAYQPNHRYKKVALEKIMADTNDSWQKTLAFFRNRL
ncbi:MAG: acyl-CoA thioester hydrolase/BAAT C-terminal domain-containing protein [Corynebacterium matruchotii]|uniref:acyl-CoA thioester hydrolase/BAAT C-terminal domain-containing protein n=1 Tax=Corynebacterium matruchotii TaxID=43768 RepID=UPI00361325E1